jgi:hypothetical protein
MHWEYSHEFFVDLLKKITPERSDELEQLLREHSIQFRVDDVSQRCRIWTVPATHEIFVATGCDARLWAYSYAYLGIYAELAKLKKDDLAARATAFQRNISGFVQLLEWAVAEDLAAIRAHRMREDHTSASLPDWASTPFDSNPESKLPGVAGGLANTAIGYILLHEIAHIVLGHKPGEGVDRILEEKEADYWAADWIAGPDDLDSSLRKPRLVGIALGLIWLLTLEIHLGPEVSTTHPPSYDRLFQVLSRVLPAGVDNVDTEGHLVWSFAQVAIALHLTKVGIPLHEQKQFNSFKEMVDYYVEIISRLKKWET